MQSKNINTLLENGAKAANQQNWAKAEEFFRDALRLDKANPIALAGLGGVFYLTGRYETAESVLQEALQQAQILPQSYYYWAKLCLQKRCWQEATVAVLQAIEMAPQIAEQYLILGDANFAQKKWASAANAYAFFLQRHGNNADIWGKLANCWLKQQRDLAALGACQKQLEIDAELENPRVKIQELLQKNQLGLSAAKVREFRSRYNASSKEERTQAVAWQKAIKVLGEGKTREGLELLAARAEEDARAKYKECSWWTGDFFSGKRLIVYDEENFTDAALFLRYLPQVKARGGIVILAVRKEWQGLAEKIPGSDYVVGLEEAVNLQAQLKVSLLALPQIFGTTWNTVYAADGLCVSKKEKKEKSRKKHSKAAWCYSLLLHEYMEKKMAEAIDYKWEFLRCDAHVSLKDKIECIQTADILISDERELCHWANLFGKPFLYLAMLTEETPWWNEGKWYRNSQVAHQWVVGEWYGIEHAIKAYLREWWEKK